MAQRMSDLLEAQAHRTFVGRSAELNYLKTMLRGQGPRVIHVHGIAGVGKTALLERFAHHARVEGATPIQLDCRHIEPTEAGLFGALHEAVGGPEQGARAVADHLGRSGDLVVLAFDNYDLFRLLDTWLRLVFIPLLPENVRALFLGRQPPVTWFSSPGWGTVIRALPLATLAEQEAEELLLALGVSRPDGKLIASSTHGHPLALKLAAAASGKAAQAQWPAGVQLQSALDELTRIFLEDVGDAMTRRVLEGASVVRRVTVSLLQALFPDFSPQDAWERLRLLPFVDGASDGLIIHDAVREAIVRSLHARDPERFLQYRRAAWRQLVGEAGAAGGGDLWRYTADMLFMIGNPVVREAFFPSGSMALTVEQATPADEAALAHIVHAHEGPEAMASTMSWWRRLPRAFSMVRDGEGRSVGFYCKFRSDEVRPAWVLDDPIAEQWYSHLRQHPMPKGELALFCRRWLSLRDGDSPGDVQAAVWLDLKRAYMELRPGLRRVYLAVLDLAPYSAVAQRLGFEVLSDHEVVLDGHRYYSAVLDFGPASVDGWLADLAGAELGVSRELQLLDNETRELVLDEGRVSLTPLEFGVMHYLEARSGKPVSRSDLLRDVWGTRYEGGSNVVDAVVRTLRKKLGRKARFVETVTGVGYRLRL